MNGNEKLRAAYALNLWTVSVSQIAEYGDVNILEQEYNTIINNLNLEMMPKDRSLLDIIKEIMDTVTNLRVEKRKLAIVEMEYQHRLKNAIWTAVPNIGSFFSPDPTAMALTLATQIGTGYMNYRRNKAEYQLSYEKEKWEIESTHIEQLNGLLKQLFETAWDLADTYDFPDEYRLTQQQITAYNKALTESNPVKRYNNLDDMRTEFQAYPIFWYHIGSAANSVYQSELNMDNLDVQAMYRAYAIECFEKYFKLNQFNLLRQDTITATWALEYLELLEKNGADDPEKTRELITIAEKNSKNAPDIRELCAFAFLRHRDYDNAIRVFHNLVNIGYNISINTQILSGLYIMKMRSSDPAEAEQAKTKYKLLPQFTDPKYILEIPDENVVLSQWKPAWNQDKTFEEISAEEDAKKTQKAEEKKKILEKARVFYRKPVLIVYDKKMEGISEYFLSVLNENRNKLEYDMPSPSRCTLEEYIKKSEEYEKRGYHTILIGDSKAAKDFYKNVKNGRWDYYEYGMRYVSYGNKTVLLARKLKNKEISEFLLLARAVNERHPVKIPSGVGSVNYTFMKELFEGQFDDVETGIATVLATIFAWPLLFVGQVLENIMNDIQLVQNTAAMKKLEFLQYCIAIYKYLDSESAIIPD